MERLGRKISIQFKKNKIKYKIFFYSKRLYLIKITII